MVGKVGLKKELKHLYNPSVNEVSVVGVPKMDFFVILDDK
jgi:hypothetical protein